MYLGEIVRLVLVSLVDATPPPSSNQKALLFGGKGSEVLNKMWSVDTSFLSEVEEAYEAGKENENEAEVKGEGLPFEQSQLTKAAKERLERVKEVVVKR